MWDAIITYSFILYFLLTKLLMLIICQALKYTLRKIQGCLRPFKNLYSVDKKAEVQREKDTKQNRASAFF